MSQANDETQQELIRRAKRGNLDAFGDLVRLHEGTVRAFLRSRLRDWASADDLAQDVFVTAFKRVSHYRGDASFESWLRGIALNHLRNFIRKKREDYVGGEGELQILFEDSLASWEEKFGGSARVDALRDCLTKLDQGACELLQDRYVKGMTVREIAKESGRGYSALTMQLYRLREGLAKCIEGTLEGQKA